MAKEKFRRKSEKDQMYEEKVLYINRCSKVVKGGRKFSFSALILVGDRKGKVGYGFAKANEVSDAIKKATELAKKAVFTFEMKGTTIPHEIRVEWDGAQVMLKPASDGTGVIAGSKVRSVLELAGIHDIVAKIQGSSNPMNQVKATVLALQSLKNKEKCFEERGIQR
jgi:small subunit ribosomal protein S5